MKEFVVLVNQKNNPIGKEDKSVVHTDNTPLHRGFSAFIFNKSGKLLLQQRSKSKKTWPLAWSNSCCGHPSPGEENEEAVRRRVRFELGLEVENLRCILPDYRYKAERYGIVENEYCPVFVATTLNDPKINQSEVEQIKWLPWDEFMQIKDDPKYSFSEWCKEEAELLGRSDEFLNFFQQVLQKPANDEMKSPKGHRFAK